MKYSLKFWPAEDWKQFQWIDILLPGSKLEFRISGALSFMGWRVQLVLNIRDWITHFSSIILMFSFSFYELHISHFTSLFSEILLYLTFCWLISNIWDNVRYRRRHPVHWCHAFHWYQTTPPFCFLGRGKMKYFSKSQKGIAQT